MIAALLIGGGYALLTAFCFAVLCRFDGGSWRVNAVVAVAWPLVVFTPETATRLRDACYRLVDR